MSKNVDYKKLSERLSADRQVLQYVGPKKTPGIDASKLPGIVIDNSQAAKKGDWVNSSSSSPRVGDDYLHDNDANKGDCIATYVATLPRAGRYRVNLLWPPYLNRATNTKVTVQLVDGTRQTIRVNQRDGRGGGRLLVGEFEFGTTATVEISNEGSDGHVIADAVQLQPGRDGAPRK